MPSERCSRGIVLLPDGYKPPRWPWYVPVPRSVSGVKPTDVRAQPCCVLSGEGSVDDGEAGALPLPPQPARRTNRNVIQVVRIIERCRNPIRPVSTENVIPGTFLLSLVFSSHEG